MCPAQCCDRTDPDEALRRFDFFVLLGFFAEKVPECEQNRRKPEKTCGNRRIPIDKALGKDEGELR
jgi:hypothetical protein